MSAPATDLDSYAESAALGMLASLDHYGDCNPPTSDGQIATPAWYANRLGKVLNARGDQLPGDGYWWWGHRYAAYAHQLLGTAPAS